MGRGIPPFVIRASLFWQCCNQQSSGVETYCFTLLSFLLLSNDNNAFSPSDDAFLELYGVKSTVSRTIQEFPNANSIKNCSESRQNSRNGETSLGGINSYQWRASSSTGPAPGPSCGPGGWRKSRSSRPPEDFEGLILHILH